MRESRGESIFDSIVGNGNYAKDKEEAQRVFDRQLREAVRLLMQCKEGRVFLRWLGRGTSPQSILQLILDHEEERHVHG